MKIAILPVTALQQNCTILWDEATRRGAVIDPGGEAERIAEQVAQLGITIERIALTHGHVDHVAGAAALNELLGGVPIEGPHQADQPIMDQVVAQAQRFGIAGARPVTPDRWLQDGDAIELAGVSFRVLHCPGHSPGSVVFVDAPGRFALVGDVLFQGSVGRTDLPGGDGPTLIRSIEQKLLPLGDDLVFLCGHGPGSSIGAERANNPYLQR